MIKFIALLGICLFSFIDALAQRAQELPFTNLTKVANCRSVSAFVALTSNNASCLASALQRTDVNEFDREGNTLLHLAARENATWAIPILIKFGGDIYSLNGLNQTPERAARNNGQEEIARMLSEISEETDRAKRALESGEQDFFLGSLARGIAIGARFGIRHDSLLHIAARTGEMVIGKQLLSSGIPVNIRNGHRETPLDIAEQNKQEEFAAMLLRKGAQKKASPSNLSQTPLDFSITEGAGHGGISSGALGKELNY